jgi:hypothetical protein
MVRGGLGRSEGNVVQEQLPIRPRVVPFLDRQAASAQHVAALGRITKQFLDDIETDDLNEEEQQLWEDF